MYYQISIFRVINQLTKQLGAEIGFQTHIDINSFLILFRKIVDEVQVSIKAHVL